MVNEARLLYSDLAARRHFVKQGDQINDTRMVMAELSAPEVLTEYELEARMASSAANLKHAADSGFVEMG